MKVINFLIAITIALPQTLWAAEQKNRTTINTTQLFAQLENENQLIDLIGLMASTTDKVFLENLKRIKNEKLPNVRIEGREIYISDLPRPFAVTSQNTITYNGKRFSFDEKVSLQKNLMKMHKAFFQEASETAHQNANSLFMNIAHAKENSNSYSQILGSKSLEESEDETMREIVPVSASQMGSEVSLIMKKLMVVFGVIGLGTAITLVGSFTVGFGVAIVAGLLAFSLLFPKKAEGADFKNNLTLPKISCEESGSTLTAGSEVLQIRTNKAGEPMLISKKIDLKTENFNLAKSRSDLAKLIVTHRSKDAENSEASDQLLIYLAKTAKQICKDKKGAATLNESIAAFNAKQDHPVPPIPDTKKSGPDAK